ncbi:protein FAR1-RELATED SEQUENCE 5-like [Sesbania bispinosa]|nr:protein FAR1-RELATED SEQUENCE 5-like [Sesbania bispinosa]
MGLIIGQKGGHSDLGFCKKDLYNHIGKENRAKIEDGDAFAALCYLQAKYDRLRLFVKEIEKVVALNVVDRTEVGNIVKMKMNKFGSPNALWTKFAKVDQISAIYHEEGDTSKKEVLRPGAVGAACNRLNKATYENPHNFVKNIEAIHRLADQMERQDSVDLNIVDMSRVVRDPTIVKTKVAPRKSEKLMKKRKCSYCKSPGHTGTYNNESLNHSKGVIPSIHGKSSSGQGPLKVKKSNKKAKHNDAVKLTQESVNDRHCFDGTNSDVNQGLNQVIYQNRVNFTTSLNEVQRNVGLGMKYYNYK